MMRTIIILRPQPGARETLARIGGQGGRGVSIPLFAVEPIAWSWPDADGPGFDALLLTSANAPRVGGPWFSPSGSLPVYAVGPATAAAARDMGLDVVATGRGGVDGVCRHMRRAGVTRALWLAGEDRTPLPPDAPVALTIAVYRAVAVDPPPDFGHAVADGIVLLHSRRAARRLRDLIVRRDRASVEIVAITRAVAVAAGTGWKEVGVATARSDAALVAAAIDRARGGADKRPR